jgi:hypothetical protein
VKTTDVPISLCPSCGYACEAASSVTGDTPEVGDLGVCFNCGALLRFGIGFVLYAATDAELAGLPSDKRQMVTASQDYIRQRGPLRRKETRQ